MRTREEQETINKACKYHPVTKEELKKLVSNGNTLLRNIDTSKITDMSELFAESNRKSFSGIENWDVSKVTNMRALFAFCSSFNQDLSNWDVSEVEDLSCMFNGCKKFNQDLNSWKFQNLKYFENMFLESAQTLNNVVHSFSESQLLPLGLKLKCKEHFKLFIKRNRVSIFCLLFFLLILFIDLMTGNLPEF